MNNELLTVEGAVDDVSWRPPANMTYAQWEAEGRAFQRINGSINWWLGDWLNEGETRYGETYAQAIEATGHRLEQLTVCKYVAGRVKRLTRIKNLSWTHHRYVAHLDTIDQSDILHCADGLKLSSRDTNVVAQLDRTARETLLRYAREHCLTGTGLMAAIDDYTANLAAGLTEADESAKDNEDYQMDTVPFDNDPANPLYNAEQMYDQQAEAWAGADGGYDWDDDPAPLAQNGKRRVIECLGLWEYAYTDEDGVEQYHLKGVTPSLEAAQMWLAYRDGTPIIRVKHINPLEGSVNDDAAISVDLAGAGSGDGSI